MIRACALGVVLLLLAGCVELRHAELRDADLNEKGRLSPEGAAEELSWPFDVPAGTSFLLWTSEGRFDAPWSVTTSREGEMQTHTERGLGDAERREDAVSAWTALSRPRAGAWTLTYASEGDATVEVWLFVCAADDERKACRAHVPDDI